MVQRYSIASPLSPACQSATSTACWEASIPVTWAPSRARGSERRPPPQPMSRTSSPARGRAAAMSRAKWAPAESRMKARRVGLRRCSGRKSPSGSHQPPARAPNLASSSGSMVDLSANSALPFVIALRVCESRGPVPVLPDQLRLSPCRAGLHGQGPESMDSGLLPGKPQRSPGPLRGLLS